MWSITKQNARIIHPDLANFWDWPNTITSIIALRMRYDSYQELIESPPPEHWDFPDIIQRHIEKLYPNIKDKTTAEISVEDVED